MWTGGEPLAANNTFLAKYLQYCRENPSSRTIRSLISVYLRDFKFDLVGRKKIASFIRDRISNNRFNSILKCWVDRDRNYRLFDEVKDFKLDAEVYLSSELTAVDFLSLIGLDGQLESANYSQEIYSAVLNIFKNNILKSESPVRLFYKIKDISISY